MTSSQEHRTAPGFVIHTAFYKLVSSICQLLLYCSHKFELITTGARTFTQNHTQAFVYKIYKRYFKHVSNTSRYLAVRSSMTVQPYVYICVSMYIRLVTYVHKHTAMHIYIHKLDYE